MPIDNIRRRGHHRGRIVDGVVHRRPGALAQDFEGHAQDRQHVHQELGRHDGRSVQVVVHGGFGDAQFGGDLGHVHPVKVHQRGDCIPGRIKVYSFGQRRAHGLGLGHALDGTAHSFNIPKSAFYAPWKLFCANA